MDQEAIKRGVKTRAIRRAEKQYYENVIKPARETMFAISRLTFMAYPKEISLRFTPGTTGRKLKHGATYGTLVAIRPFDRIDVLPEGYKRPQTFNAGWWELLLP